MPGQPVFASVGHKAFSTSSEAPGGSPQGSPFSMLEQVGRETLKKVEEVAQQVQSATTTGAVPGLSEIKTMAESNAAELQRTVMPLFSALLILARNPGTSITAEQEAKFAEVLPPVAVDAIKSLATIVPEDPQVAQLKKIADKLESIEAKIEGRASEAKPQAAPQEPADA
eukprot:CAMPEP_0169334744 /NCGR_PEP_ID=MMETSP1017-20121227/15956_1 /TAXON_ID=342587 /ORGANISM="Karlodinium micrum, Strain CCMP2283" /LENGTH=169 /DNA_ID=CAMNT_0009430053 /DNA_START=47 /DNA_END=553 /DNA_ORIENTATION=-